MSRLAFVFPDLLDLLRRPQIADVPDDRGMRNRLPRAPGWGDRRRARVPGHGV